MLLSELSCLHGVACGWGIGLAISVGQDLQLPWVDIASMLG